MIDGAPPFRSTTNRASMKLPDRLRVHSPVERWEPPGGRWMRSPRSTDGPHIPRWIASMRSGCAIVGYHLRDWRAGWSMRLEASEEPESRLMLETQETRNADVERRTIAAVRRAD